MAPSHLYSTCRWIPFCFFVGFSIDHPSLTNFAIVDFKFFALVFVFHSCSEWNWNRILLVAAAGLFQNQTTHAMGLQVYSVFFGYASSTRQPPLLLLVGALLTDGRHEWACFPDCALPPENTNRGLALHKYTHLKYSLIEKHLQLW